MLKGRDKMCASRRAWCQAVSVAEDDKNISKRFFGRSNQLSGSS